MAGLSIRFILMPMFSVGYDSDFWALIIRNIESGNGLYDLEGYYYTPVWGYILGLISSVQEMFLDIGVMGERVLEALPVESYTSWFTCATVTTVEFNFWVKLPFVVSDIIVGYLIYWLIKDRTGDEKKAAWGFGLWFLCPLVMMVTSVSGMFDTFSALFILLCLILIRKNYYFFGGILFSFAVLTKFFPAFLIFVLIAYILLKHRDDGKGIRNLAIAAFGAAVAALVLMLPQIMDHTVMDSLSFLMSRANVGSGGIGASSVLDFIASKLTVIAYCSILVASIFISRHMYKSGPVNLDDKFFKYCFITVAVTFLYPPAPQYLVLLIPFLAYCMVMSDRKLSISWILLSIGSTLFICAGNFILLMSAGSFTDIISMDYVMSMIDAFQKVLVGGMSGMSVMYLTGAAIQYAGILSIFWVMYRSWKIKKEGCAG